jgi:hypothetical protein
MDGYSGDPLSLIPFRPDQSVEDWMYVYDRNKSSKMSAAGEKRAVGIVPPNTLPALSMVCQPGWMLRRGRAPLAGHSLGLLQLLQLPPA